MQEDICIKGYGGNASNDENCIDYDIELIGETGLTVIDYCIWTLLILSLIIDILSFKYRSLAKACIYNRLLIVLLKRMIPNTNATES